MKERGT